MYVLVTNIHNTHEVGATRMSNLLQSPQLWKQHETDNKDVVCSQGSWVTRDTAVLLTGSDASPTQFSITSNACEKLTV